MGNDRSPNLATIQGAEHKAVRTGRARKDFRGRGTAPRETLMVGPVLHLSKPREGATLSDHSTLGLGDNDISRASSLLAWGC